MSLSKSQRSAKRIFDFLGSLSLLILCFWIIGLAWIAASLDTRNNGFFLQHRVGRNGKLFRLIKIRTMRTIPDHTTTVTTSKDPRITKLGSFFRRSKIDELPQLINVLIGDMSFVGPRPDVPGYADKLTGSDKVILSIRPGITGPASLKYRDEESILAKQADPEEYNRTVIYPDKVRINRSYIENWQFADDIYYIWRTISNT